MKRIFLLLMISLICFISAAQTIMKSIKNDKYPFVEQFYCLNDSSQNKNGNYKKYYINHIGDSILFEQGQYKNDVKIGVWKYYEKGSLDFEYNYDTDSISVFNGMKVDGMRINRPVFYLGSKKEVRIRIAYNVQMPKVRSLQEKDTRIVVGIYVDNNGNVSKYEIIEGENDAYGKEAIRVASLLPNCWLPAKKSGEDITYRYNLPISFKYHYPLR